MLQGQTCQPIILMEYRSDLAGTNTICNNQPNYITLSVNGLDWV